MNKHHRQSLSNLSFGAILVATCTASSSLPAQAQNSGGWSEIATGAAAGYCLARHPYIPPPGGGLYTAEGFEVTTSPGVVAAVRRNYVFHRGPTNFSSDSGQNQSCKQACTQWGLNSGSLWGVPLRFKANNSTAPIADGVGDMAATAQPDADFYLRLPEVVAGLTGRPLNYHESDVAQADYCCCQLAYSAPPPTIEKVCVDFEAPLVSGTRFGVPANQNPGDTAISSSSVSVTVEKFIDGLGGTQFNEASVDSLLVPGGSNQSLRINNIGLLFDFTQLGFQIAKANLEFLDLGGSENLTVNGEPIFAGEIGKAPSTIGAVNIAVTSTPATGGYSGSIALEGQLKSLQIGGQEFWIDQVCVYPK